MGDYGRKWKNIPNFAHCIINLEDDWIFRNTQR